MDDLFFSPPVFSSDVSPLTKTVWDNPVITGGKYDPPVICVGNIINSTPKFGICSSCGGDCNEASQECTYCMRHQASFLVTRGEEVRDNAGASPLVIQLSEPVDTVQPSIKTKRKLFDSLVEWSDADDVDSCSLSERQDQETHKKKICTSLNKSVLKMMNDETSRHAMNLQMLKDLKNAVIVFECKLLDL